MANEEGPSKGKEDPPLLQDGDQESDSPSSDEDFHIQRPVGPPAPVYFCQRYCHLCLLVCERPIQTVAPIHQCRITLCPTPDDIPACWVCMDLRIRVRGRGHPY